jgi:hypothetical protein
VDIWGPHRKHLSSIVLFTARCIATEVIRLLPAYALSRECVYRVVAQQRVYMSQYANHMDVDDLLWLTAVLLCHLQDHEDLCHGWWQTNSILQQFQNHYYSILNFQICSVLALKSSSITDLRYLFHAAIQRLNVLNRSLLKSIKYTYAWYKYYAVINITTRKKGFGLCRDSR